MYKVWGTIQYRIQCFGLQFDKTVQEIICSYLDGSTLDKYICFKKPGPKTTANNLYVISYHTAQSPSGGTGKKDVETNFANHQHNP